MSYVDLIDDTICALITTPGLSGISVLRVSGPRALDLVRPFCTFVPQIPESHKIYYGLFRSQQEDIDEVLISYFAQGRSFTGDQTLEISTHGGFTSANRVMSELLAGGCRAAERGEFSFRAFYNGKLDLVQAEGILSIIHSRSEQARAIAMKQLKGHLSHRLEAIEENLIQLLAQLEASIDFSTEDIEPYSLAQLRNQTVQTRDLCVSLHSTFGRGRVLSQGLNVVLAGAVNVGKSSLYNSLLGESRAIVTDIPGTTRDVLESTYTELGSPVQLVDTAGLRTTSDVVEKLGIEKTRQRLSSADLLLIVLDINKYSAEDIHLESSELPKTIFVFNKVDQAVDINAAKQSAYQFLDTHMDRHQARAIIFTSAKNGEGIQDIKFHLDKLSYVDIDSDEAVITQHRHFDSLSTCLDNLNQAIHVLDESPSYDLLALHMQMALKNIYSILGKEYDDQVLDRVFKQFCIGK